MTALQCTLHPFEATIDLQADIAVLKLHPVSVQSVPIEEFGLSQKLRVTLQLAGVMTASVVVPSDSSDVASSDDADASAFTSAEAPLIALPGSGVDSSVHACKVSNVSARPVLRTRFLIEALQCGANRDTRHGCLALGPR
jgi:hypothetical protein